MQDWIKSFAVAFGTITFIGFMMLMASILPWQGYVALSFILLAIISYLSIKVDEWE